MSDDRDPTRFDELIRAGMQPLEPELRDNLRRLARAVDDPSAGQATTGDERYTVDREVGRGGVGVVYRGHDRQLHRTVAIKLLGERYRNDPAMVARFVGEARINARLQHPGIVPVHEVGERDDVPFFTMKLVEGETLSAQLAARASPDDDRSRLLRVFESVCQTIAYAHDRNVIHRDLKPSNVMVGAFGEVQVMDWGLAKPIGSEECVVAESGTARVSASPRRSITGSVMGTPAYMSPEQARGEVDALDRRTDVFALGSILCELLTGAPAHRGEDPAAVMDAARRGDVSDAFGRLADVPVDLSALRDLASGCLSPEQSGRPADAGEVAAAIAAHFRSVETRLRAAEIAGARARSRALAAIVVAVAIALLAAGAWWVESNRRTRVADLTETVNGGVEELRRAANGARTRTNEDPGNDGAWSAVVTVADQLERTSKSGDLPERLRDRVAAVCSDARTAATEARAHAATHRRDRAMVERLEAIHLRAANPAGLAARAGAYERAFRDYGLEPLDGDVEVSVARVRTSPIRDALVEGLDAWIQAYLQVRRDRADVQRHLRLLQVAAGAASSGVVVRQRIHELNRVPGSEREARLDAIVEAVDVDRDSPQTIRLVAGHQVLFGRLKDGVSLFERAIARHPDDFWLHFGCAHLLAQLEDDVAALRHYEAARAITPGVAAPWVKIAQIELGRGNRDAARRAITHAETLPGDSTGWLDRERAKLWIEFGDRDRALAALDRSAASAGKASMLYFLASGFASLDDLDRAAAALRRAVTLHEGEHPLKCMSTLGMVERRRGHLFAARDAYRRILAIEATEETKDGGRVMLAGHQHKAFIALGKLDVELGDLDHALGNFLEATKRGPTKGRIAALVPFARAHVSRSEFVDAERTARRALKIDDENAAVHRVLADALYGQARYRDAAQAEARAVDAGAEPRPKWQRALRVRVTIDRDRDAYLEEDATFDDVATPFTVAEALAARGDYVRAVALWRRGFGDDAHPHRTWPEQVILAAGAASHVDTLRSQAIVWVDRSLDRLLESVRPDDAHYETLRTARRTMCGWAHSARLGPLFDPALVRDHPREVRDRCAALAERIRDEAEALEKRLRSLESD